MALSLKAQRLAVVAILLLWCTLLIAIRAARTDTSGFTFLWWNLLLAFIPLMASTAFGSAHRQKQPVAEFVWFCVWLLFLPNAPYILTDLIHLRPHPIVPLWYDLTLLLSCAGTGLILGYISLLDIQLMVEQSSGTAIGWTVAIGSLLLSGFGVYIGRILRWNSWDAFTNPLALFSDLGDAIARESTHSNPLVAGLIFGVTLTLGYAALRVLALSPAQGDSVHK